MSHLPAPRIRCATRQSDWPMKPDTLNLYGALTFPRTKRVALIGALLRSSIDLSPPGTADTVRHAPKPTGL